VASVLRSGRAVGSTSAFSFADVVEQLGVPPSPVGVDQPVDRDAPQPEEDRHVLEPVGVTRVKAV
jgi:hypothetical protein